MMTLSTDSPTIKVAFTERELHVLTCAMAGNFPPGLSDVRMPTLRKLARASRALGEMADYHEPKARS